MYSSDEEEEGADDRRTQTTSPNPHPLSSIQTLLLPGASSVSATTLSFGSRLQLVPSTVAASGLELFSSPSQPLQANSQQRSRTKPQGTLRAGPGPLYHMPLQTCVNAAPSLSAFTLQSSDTVQERPKCRRATQH